MLRQVLRKSALAAGPRPLILRRTITSDLFDESQVKVTVNHKTQVATITLKAPERYNAIDEEMGRQVRWACLTMQDKIDQFDAVVLTGHGKAFSSGGDLAFLEERTHDTPSRNAEIMMKFYERMLILRRLPVPTIAAINGPAIGAGLSVALLCDLRVASETANMGFSFTKLGLHPGMGSTFFLPKLVGPENAAKLLLTGELLTGAEAAAMGLVCKAVPHDQVLAEAHALASVIAKNGPIAVRSLTRTLRMQNDVGLEHALRREADSQAASYASSDMKEGLAAFRERRPPRFIQSERYGHGMLITPT